MGRSLWSGIVPLRMRESRIFIYLFVYKSKLLHCESRGAGHGDACWLSGIAKFGDICL